MSLTRRIARSALLIVTLAYALVLGQVAHARMVGAHGPAGHTQGALESLCAEHASARTGHDLPADGNGHPCLDCTLCAVKIFAAATSPGAVPAAWGPRTAGAVHYPRGFDPAHRSRPPPAFKARGPPVLI